MTGKNSKTNVKEIISNPITQKIAISLPRDELHCGHPVSIQAGWKQF